MAANKYFTMKQDKEENLTKYYRRFKNVVKVFEHYGASTWCHPCITVEEYSSSGLNNMEMENIYWDNKDRFNACGSIVKEISIVVEFFKGTSKDEYGSLVSYLEGKYARQMNQYPTSSFKSAFKQ